MRIVSVNVHYQDKLGYQDYYLGKEWKKMGHEVHFVASDVHFDFPDYDHTVKHIIGGKKVGTGLFYNDYGVPVHRLKGTSRKYTGMIWLWGFKKKVKDLKPDILVLHGILSYQTIRAAFWGKKLGCSIIMDDHTNTLGVRKDKLAAFAFWIFRKLMARRITNTADKLIATSATTLDVMRDCFGLSGPKVSMVPLGTDTTIFRKDIQLRREGRQWLGVEDEKIVVLYTGKMYPVKKVDLIIDALDEIGFKNYPKVVLALVGDMAADYKILLDEKIKSTEFPVIVRQAVAQEFLPALYNGAEIAVWPNALTTSTIDASACGCPIIISDYMPERIKRNNGIMIKAGDLEELKSALITLINNPDLRKEMGMNGIKFIQEELGWKAISQRFISLN